MVISKRLKGSKVLLSIESERPYGTQIHLYL